MNRFQKKERQNRKIALERIHILFTEANGMFRKDKKLANRYVELARKVAMKHRLRIPAELKRKFCKHCYSYLKPGVNLRVRTQEGKTVYYCLECKKFMRFPHKKSKK